MVRRSGFDDVSFVSKKEGEYVNRCIEESDVEVFVEFPNGRSRFKDWFPNQIFYYHHFIVLRFVDVLKRINSSDGGVNLKDSNILEF